MDDSVRRRDRTGGGGLGSPARALLFVNEAPHTPVRRSTDQEGETVVLELAAARTLGRCQERSE
jgi:hypothetical protein